MPLSLRPSSAWARSPASSALRCLAWRGVGSSPVQTARRSHHLTVQAALSMSTEPGRLRGTIRGDWHYGSAGRSIDGSGAARQDCRRHGVRRRAYTEVLTACPDGLHPTLALQLSYRVNHPIRLLKCDSGGKRPESLTCCYLGSLKLPTLHGQKERRDARARSDQDSTSKER
jgi:hypothetical protein